MLRDSVVALRNNANLISAVNLAGACYLRVVHRAVKGNLSVGYARCGNNVECLYYLDVRALRGGYIAVLAARFLRQGFKKHSVAGIVYFKKIISIVPVV